MRKPPFKLGAVVIVLGSLVLVSVWALRPLPLVSHLIRLPALALPPGEPQLEAASRLVALDTRAFDTPLWVAPPAPPTPPAPPPPPPPPPPPSPPPAPLRLQLIAIVSEPSGAERQTPDEDHPPLLSVLFYDPDTDKLLTLRAGDQIGPGGKGGRMIQQVTARTVTIRDGDSLSTIGLRDDEAASLNGAFGGVR